MSPRIVPPNEARFLIAGTMRGIAAWNQFTLDLLNTAAVLGDRLAAIQAEHEPSDEQNPPHCVVDGEAHPCTTVRLATTGEDGKHFETGDRR